MIAPILLIDAGIVGFSIAGGLGMLSYGWAHRRWQPALMFALMSSGLAVNSIGNLLVQMYSDVAVVIGGLRMMDVSNCVIAMLVPFFYGAMTERRVAWRGRLLSGCFGVIGLFALFRANGLWSSVDSVSLIDLGWLGAVYRPQGAQNVWRFLAWILAVLLILDCAYVAWSSRRESPVMAWSVLICLVPCTAGVVYAVGLFHNLWRGPILWSYVGLGIYLGLGVSVYLREKALVLEHRELLRSVREANERLQLALLVGKVGTWRTVAATRQTTWDASLSRLMGLGAVESIRIEANAFDNVHPEDRPGAIADFRRAIDSRRDFVSEFRICRPDGEYRWVRNLGRAFYEDSGELLYVTGAVVDIHDRKMLEATIRESERKYREIFNATSDAMIVHDEEGAPVDVNAQVCAMFGCDRSTAMGLTPDTLSSGEPSYSGAEARERIRLAIQAGPQIFPWRLRRCDGSPFWCEVALRACEIAGQRRVIAAIRDITERKEAEERLQQMEIQLAHVARLSAMGEMVAEISHDLNQPLYAILNYARAARNLLASEAACDRESLCRWTEEISDAAKWASEIVKRLRSFSRRTRSERSVCRLNEIIEESMALVASRAQRAHVVLKRQLCGKSPVVLADRVEIQQVLVNLLQNAMEAMEGTAVDRRQVSVRTTMVDQCVEFSVSDRGIGLPPDEGLRIFEAFVTTKPGGVGMGLAIGKTILEAHGGKLWATSNPGGGATFYGQLPLVNKDQAADE